MRSGKKKLTMKQSKLVKVKAVRAKSSTLYDQSKVWLRKSLASPKFDPNHFKIIYMGDSWAAEGNMTGIAVLNEALNVSRSKKPLLLLHGGDIVFTGTKEQLNFFKKKVNKKVPDTPVFVAVGNHESTRTNGNSSLNNYKNIIGPSAIHFALRIPFIKIIGLNSVGPTGSGPYGLPPSELAYLKEQLKTKAKNIIITTHVPPSDWKFGQDEFLKLTKQSNVSLFLFSHIHAYKRFQINGKPAIISGGAGAALDKNQINHIVELSVNSGVITTKKIPISWQL
ncbi:metallophosphoesterase [Paenibacillus sp. JX-17]|uniref:Metallophosphoesterase n=1 Tax=Paenibacillus lacisoli TaxID=3064525 RepID=A0ABT9C8H3_9BACL|nr:metallophosphoesterase [Paenibacillus sp. JX-17]MDO7904974.1 metallophosphoesterase [Paenibacillus sp. JX-17]